MKANTSPRAVLKPRRRMIIAAILLVLMLFVPLPFGRMKDGGTRVYRAVTYKIVRWERLYTEVSTDETAQDTVIFDGKYRKTSVYWFSDAARSDAELWQTEQESPAFRMYLVEN